MRHYLPQGLQPGDQLLKISGLPVKAATHREAVALILGRSRLELKVRSGGLLPVRLSRSEPVSWQRIRPAERQQKPTDTVRTNTTNTTNTSQDSDLDCPERRINITLTGQQGLGCSICKVRESRQTTWETNWMNDSVVLIQFWIICIMRLCGPQAPAEISANPVKLQQSSFDLQVSVGALETGERERCLPGGCFRWLVQGF